MNSTQSERYADYVVKNPWKIVLLSILTVMLSASGGQYLQFTNDFRQFFSDDNPQLIAFDEMENTYTKADNVMFVIAPDDGNVFTTETLAIVEELTEKAWQLPFSSRVDSISNYQHTIAEEDDLLVDDLVIEAKNLSQKEVDYIRDVAMNELLLVSRLISPQGHVTAINVTVQLPRKDINEVAELVAASRAIRGDILASHPNIKIYLSGISIMDNAFGESAQSDMKTLMPMMFLVVIIVLGILLRSFTATLTTVIMVITAILFAMGAMGWSGLKLTPPSASAPTIILTMAIADAVHVLVTFLHNLRQGSDKAWSMQNSLATNIQPIFITSVTTAIGFLSMNFSDVPPFQDLGNIVAVGVMAAFVLSITLLPALVMLLPVRIKQVEKDKLSVAVMDKIADFVILNRRTLLWGTGIASLMLISLLPLNKLDDQFIEYFDESIEFRRDTDFTADNLNSTYNIQYSLQQGESGGISDPEFLRQVELFTNWLRSLDNVTNVHSIIDIIKRLNKNMNGDDPAFYRLPESRELAAQYLLLYELSLPYGLDLNDQIDIDKSATRLTVSFDQSHTEEVLAFEREIAQWLETNMPDIKFSAASMGLMFAHIGHRNVKSMLMGTTVALIVISFILILALRSWKIGLISLLPNLIPAGIAFGIWGLLVGQVGLSLSIVVGMTLGIVVDDTVHFLSKYLTARRTKGLEPQAAIRYAFNTVGMALWVTSFVLVLGFIVLGQSHFALNADMGIMTAMTIAVALIIDFLFLPPLLMKIEEKKHA